MSYMICFRFVATHESYAHPIYKRKLIEYEKTEYTDIFGRARWPGAPQRVLETPFFDDWRSLPSDENELDQPIIGRSTIHGVVSLIFNKVSFTSLCGLCTDETKGMSLQEKEIRRFAGTVPNMTTTGDLESMAMYAGQSVGLIKEILPAGEVVKSLVEEAQLLILKKFKNAT